MYKRLVKFIRDWYQTDDFIPLHEPRFNEIDREYVLDAIDSTFVSSVGEYANRFEKGLAGYLKARFAVVTVNGTCALQVALRLAGVGSGDEVITQPLTFVATANAIIYNNASPVFVDVNKETLGLCPDALDKFLNESAEQKNDGTYNTKSGLRIAAIVPMHTFGHPCQMERICSIAGKWGIPIVEDAAESLGSKIKEAYCGTFGNLGIFSFNGNKTITCGGGGAIITDDRNLAEKAKHLTTTAKKDHPWEFFHDEIGYNYRMPNLNAALACAQLSHLDAFLADKRRLANAYGDFFKDTGLGTFIREPDGCTSNFWLNGVIMPDEKHRDDFLKETNGAGVMTRPVWKLMPDLPMYRGCQTGNLDNARWLVKRVVNLPSSARPHV